MIGSTLKALLAKRRLSVAELSERIAVPVQTLYSIIRRDNMSIDLDVLLRICAALEVPLSAFCGASGAEEAISPEELALLERFRALDAHGRRMAELVIAAELDRLQP